MPPTTDTAEWIGVQEAASIISKNSGRDESHPVTADYVRVLAKSGKIRTYKEPGKGASGFKTRYKRTDVEGIVVKQHDFPRRVVTEPTG